MKGRGYIAVALILLVALTGAMRTLAQWRHDAVLPRAGSASRLSQMNTFALSLVLGGLRGPLVMILWTSSENQKTERNLEDIDTKIELIRMLQPEFDSVHIFQIWNKAYNLSVQMANLRNKYATILDGLDYGHRVDQERPDNVNILVAMAEVYLNKLGASISDRRYYVARVKEDTLPKAVADDVRKARAGWRRTQHDTLVDATGRILPQYLAPRPVSPTLAKAGYNGAELQYLQPYNERGAFPFGVHPLALAYNYYKKGQVVAAVTGRKHLHMGDAIVDSRPAVTLKTWSEDEWELGRRMEIELLGQPVPDDRLKMETVTEKAALGTAIEKTQAHGNLAREAIFSYNRAVQVAEDAIAEYQRHLSEPDYSVAGLSTYDSHIDTCRAIVAFCAADRDYLAVLTTMAGLTPEVSAKVEDLKRAAREEYQRAIDAYYLMILRYYTEDDVAKAVYPAVAGPGTDKTSLAGPKFDRKLYPKIHEAVRAYLKQNNRGDLYAEDVREYETYIQRASTRLQLLN